MFYPKVKFMEIPIGLETNMIWWFLFRHEWGWGRVIIKRHPALKPIYKLKQEKQIIKFLRNYILIRYDEKGAKHVIMHEICHFLYFEKWKELFPKSRRRTWDYPHIEWHLSELIAPIILNDKRIQKILKQKASFYREHQRVNIKGVSAPKYFSKLYANCFKRAENFDYFIKEAYKIIKIHKKKFLKI